MGQRKRPWRAELLQDWHRYSEGAPASWKTILAHLVFDAGFLAVFLFRMAAALESRGRARLARLVHRLNMVVSAAELSPDAEVKAGLYLPHPYGVTIGTGCRVGPDVTLFQGAVLGAKRVDRDGDAPRREYPTIERGATIYPHAVIFGGIRVGEDAVILTNSVVGRDVPAGRTFGGIPATEIRGPRPDHDTRGEPAAEPSGAGESR